MAGPPLVVATGQLFGLIVAAEAVDGLNFVGELVPELTVVGAVVIAVRYLHRAYKTGLEVYASSSQLSAEILERERTAFAARETSYVARIAMLESRLMGSHPKDERTGD